MSAKISGQVWDLALPQRDILILLAITDHANHEGVMWPGVSLIAWKTGYSKRTVMRTLASLVKRGILLRRTRPGKETVYVANLDAAPKKTERPKARRKKTTSDIAMTHDTAVSLVTTSRVAKTHTHDTPSAKVGDEPSLKIEPSQEHRLVVFRAYEDAFGLMLTPMLVDELKALVEEYGEAWVVDAMRVAVTNGKRSLGYAKGILRRWQTEGREAKEARLAPVAVVETPAQRAAREAAEERERAEWRRAQGVLP